MEILDHAHHFEPETIDLCQTVQEDALCSIAVSLRRIADALERISNGQSSRDREIRSLIEQMYGPEGVGKS